MTQEIQKEIQTLVEKAKIAYLGSVGDEGFPNVKAMLTRRRDGLWIHYFSTNTSSKRTAQFRKNPKACVYFCNEPKFMGLMLVGTLEVCTDSSHKELLWRPGDEMYYPKGVTDDDYCVYKFTAKYGNYYHGLSNTTFTKEDLPDIEG